MGYRILAAFIFFTRLPFWRLAQVPAECYKTVVNYWPLAGWLTGGVLASVLWLSAQILPYSVAVILALAGRLLLTGCLHEDGLADFFDGLGGGTSRERILAIMKDSFIGSYGVTGLVVYFALLFSLLHALPLPLACAAVLTGDPWGKFSAAQLVNFLPYARREEDSKAKVVYNKMSVGTFSFALLTGVLPAVLFLPYQYVAAALFSLLTIALLIVFLKGKLQGYTGDCCGAAFLLCELNFYLGINILYHYYVV